VTPNPYEGTDLGRLVRGVDLLHEIIDKVPPTETPVWILPPDLLPGATSAWGLPVRRLDGADRPYLAFDISDPGGD
jgi:hypothetical protein